VNPNKYIQLTSAW
jgi:hypothetical protein